MAIGLKRECPSILASKIFLYNRDFRVLSLSAFCRERGRRVLEPASGSWLPARASSECSSQQRKPGSMPCKSSAIWVQSYRGEQPDWTSRNCENERQA